MSGVNWIPAWALGGTDRDDRFRVVSDGRVNGSGLRNWYSDPLIVRAQALLATEAAGALAGHEAVWMWDLGNENSNCVIPPTASIRAGVAATDRLRDPYGRPGAPGVTVGLHMEDLENDRMLGPREAVRGMRCPLDARLSHLCPLGGRPHRRAAPALPGRCHALARRRPRRAVRGVRSPDLPPGRSDRRGSQTPGRELSGRGGKLRPPTPNERLRRCKRRAAWARCSGATPTTTRPSGNDPPLDLAVHERSFGLWRADGSPKPSVAVVEAFAGARRLAGQDDYPWIDLEPDEFLVAPEVELPRLYGLYRTSEQGARAG